MFKELRRGNKKINKMYMLPMPMDMYNKLIKISKEEGVLRSVLLREIIERFFIEYNNSKE